MTPVDCRGSLCSDAPSLPPGVALGSRGPGRATAARVAALARSGRDRRRRRASRQLRGGVLLQRANPGLDRLRRSPPRESLCQPAGDGRIAQRPAVRGDHHRAGLRPLRAQQCPHPTHKPTGRWSICISATASPTSWKTKPAAPATARRAASIGRPSTGSALAHCREVQGTGRGLIGVAELSGARLVVDQGDVQLGCRISARR